MDHYQAWRAGKVMRMHTAPQLHHENVAEHTWGLMLALLRFWPNAPALVMKQFMVHDLGEQYTGDMPGHVKWANAEAGAIIEKMETEHKDKILPVQSPSRREGMLLEVFDRLDFCVSCIHEMRLGNLNSALYFGRSYDRAVGIINSYDINDPVDLEYRGRCMAFLDEVTRLKTTYLQHVDEREYDLGR